MNYLPIDGQSNQDIHHVDTVVVGAGIAGLAAARKIANSGQSVLVIDKGRRIGGRAATRRSGGFTFTHGAQFLTAHDPDFQRVCKAALAAGALTQWQIGEKPVMIGTPSMRDFAAFLGAGLPIKQATEITSIAVKDDRISVSDFAGDIAICDRLIMTAPAPQTAKLLAGAAPELAATASSAVYAPCWTAMFGFDDGDRLPLAGKPFTSETGSISWACWENARPGAEASNLALTVQTSPDWSQTHLESESHEVAAQILDLVRGTLFQSLPDPAYAACHRWRYARVVTPADADATRISACGRMAIAGDWLGAARIETAFLSGKAAAATVMAMPTGAPRAMANG